VFGGPAHDEHIGCDALVGIACDVI
jgi:hypothetical protein